MFGTRLACAVAGSFVAVSAFAGLKDEMRQPWRRDDINYIRGWKVAGVFHCDLPDNCLDIPGGESAASPASAQKRADGSVLEWRDDRSWDDFITFDSAQGERDGAVAYAVATIDRASAGKALLSIGSSDGIRVWLNGKPVLSRDGRRSVTADEDQVEVELAAGANTLLIKAAAAASFTARVLETGAVLVRPAEIGPTLIEMQPEMFTVRTDVNTARAAADPVKIEVVKPGGAVVFTGSGARGALVVVDAKGWPDGPYEVRASTLTPEKRLYVTHLAWFKGDSLAMARALAADAARADDADPAGFTLKMLAEMVDDRLGAKLADIRDNRNPWPQIHSPLMEYAELELERAGRKDARVRASGFVRLAWRDPVDGTPQYARAYLPASYDAAKKWPLVLRLHGYNPANPPYWRWWSADSRHSGLTTEYSQHRQVIYVDVHGRGNTQYLGLGDADIERVLAESRRVFNVDDNRVYLTGDSMGGWGTWHFATRHPDVFAAIAPVFGGADYHAQMSEAQLAALTPAERYLNERASTWAGAEALNNTPIYVHHGDADQAVNVEWSRWAVHMLQRWGYDVRYHEYPGRIHEALEASNADISMEWFLQHERNPDPRQVRLRSAELRHAKSYWVDVRQFGSPMEFAKVDAEIVERNVIRLDTQNVVDVVLTPSTVLIDPARPVTVVWNGVAHERKFAAGAIHLADASYPPGALVKTASLPGGIADFTTTPFAVVVGTVSKDPEMKRLLRQKAEEFVAAWKDWQKFAPRIFADTEIGDGDLAKYSLLLLGGADANAVTAKFAGRLPAKLTKTGVTIDGNTFAAPGALLQMVYPNPRNSDRYVWLFAANSADALFGASMRPQGLPVWDFVIVDGHLPAHGQHATPIQTALVSGFFDRNWRGAKSLIVAGDTAARARANHVRRPTPADTPSAELLDRYVGKYRLPNGRTAEIRREGAGLIVIADGGDRDELWPQSAANFYLPHFGIWVLFDLDASGPATAMKGSGAGDFTAARVD